MNIRIIEEKYKDRFIFLNTVFCKKTHYPIFSLKDTLDDIEYQFKSPSGVDVEMFLQNLIIEKRNRKIEKILA